jgi:hypothetical protein
VRVIIPYGQLQDFTVVATNTNNAPSSFAPMYTNTQAYSVGAIVTDDRRANQFLNYDFICIADVPVAASRETYRPEQPGGVHPSWARYRVSNKWAVYDPSPTTRTLSEGPSAGYSTYPTMVTGGNRSIQVDMWNAITKMDGATGYDYSPDFYQNDDGTIAMPDTFALLGVTCNSVVLSYFTSALPWTTAAGSQTFTPSTASRRAQDMLITIPAGWVNAAAGYRAEIRYNDSSQGTVPGVGMVIRGKSVTIGDSLPGVEAGIIDYSSVTTDTYGNTSITKRGYAKTVRMRVRVASSAIDRVHERLAQLRATPAVWVAEDAFKSTIVYGVFKSFSVDIAYPTVSYCTIEVNGIA